MTYGGGTWDQLFINGAALIQTNETKKSTQMPKGGNTKWHPDTRGSGSRMPFIHLTISSVSGQVLRHTLPSATASGNLCCRYCQPAAFQKKKAIDLFFDIQINCYCIGVEPF